MTVRQLVIGGGVFLLGASLSATPAAAGGLFVPGSGAVSASRAGAAVASTDDGEAMSINPAGFAKSEGLTLTISATLIKYYMSFSRAGSYDASVLDPNVPFTGDRYQTVENDPKPPLGIGSFQPLPVLVVSYALPQVKGLTIAGGLYTPSGYPFRDMSQGFDFEPVADPNTPSTNAPPPTRYDVWTQESALLLPSIAVAYRVLPDLDIGARFTAGRLKSKTQVVVWGTPGNVEEDVKKDALFTADVSDGFIPGAGLGATYRIGSSIELGAAWTSPLVIRAKGTAESLRGSGNDASRVIGPIADAESICATGGTMAQQKACISLQMPMTATIGARYKFVDGNNEEFADVELNANWENWGKRCDYYNGNIVDSDCTSPGQYRVQIDAGLYNQSGTYAGPINETNGANFVNLGLQDTFGIRLGGSYKHKLGNAAKVVGRAGFALDTAAAKDGWYRANFDGAARRTITVGGAYQTGTLAINAGFGFIHEGTNKNSGTCNPTPAEFGCNGDSTMTPPEDRVGPDPTNPLLTPDTQFENPYNNGSIKSHYLMFMLGMSKGW